MYIHWSVCWLKKTKNKRFDDGFFFFPLILWWIVVVYIKLIINFLIELFIHFSLTAIWSREQANHKGLEKFSTGLVMSAIQIQTLKDVNVNHMVQGSSYAGQWRADPPGTLNFHPALKLILSLNTLHSSFKSYKTSEKCEY